MQRRLLTRIAAHVLQSRKGQASILGEIGPLDQTLVFAVEQFPGNVGEFVAAQVQAVQLRRLEYTARPCGQVVIAQVQGLDGAKVGRVEYPKFVVADIQPAKARTGHQRVKVRRVREIAILHLQAFKMLHPQDRPRHRHQGIATDIQDFDVGKSPEKPVRTPCGHAHTAQIQRSDCRDRNCQLRQITGLQALEIQVQPGSVDMLCESVQPGFEEAPRRDRSVSCIDPVRVRAHFAGIQPVIRSTDQCLAKVLPFGDPCFDLRIARPRRPQILQVKSRLLDRHDASQTLQLRRGPRLPLKHRRGFWKR
ncbi:hypothetical protein D3C72_412380 [compost metagenome]